ncbi:ADP-ribosylglycohydrolase family protein [Streptomyces sp. F-1]|uniref:ADP-ribosylglycohydrolase family protein n=1 Tax=Streptomyces sp. F-1 TaxID=463642 RepID=UPI00086B59E8|nr:ADP-ribosylglycohydrolase family protein [Streptomyces sp. F-1]SFY50652.1 Agglutinin receptor [Streptomyces sp. F-1]
MASTACTPPPPLPSPEAAPGLRDRARGALLGLAVGDALGAPAENLKPSEIRARWGRITDFVTDRPQGTDDTEYALFSGLLLARHGSALTPAHVEAAWHEWIADRAEGTFRGAGFSERGTLENLRRGLAAPVSAQHRHAWSDGLAMRAAPFGVFPAGRPGEAARLVAIDGAVSHEGEGIHGGQAVAAGVAAAMAGAPVPVVIAAALAVIPDDSWTARSLRRAVAVAHRGELAVRSAVVIGGYPWTDLAPEAVALAFGAYATADGDFREAVLTAVNMGRDADTTAAVAGALAGATRGAAAIPPHWAEAIGPVRGRCLPSMAGRRVEEVADLLVPPPAEPPAPLRPTEPLVSPLVAAAQPIEPPTPSTSPAQQPTSPVASPLPAALQPADPPAPSLPPAQPSEPPVPSLSPATLPTDPPAPSLPPAPQPAELPPATAPAPPLRCAEPGDRRGKVRWSRVLSPLVGADREGRS